MKNICDGLFGSELKPGNEYWIDNRTTAIFIERKKEGDSFKLYFEKTDGPVYYNENENGQIVFKDAFQRNYFKK